MAEVYIIRAILDAEEDVIRDIAITTDKSLIDLHHAIVKAFDLNRGEMSSFFKSNESWDQGQEISMMEFDPDSQKNPLETTLLQEGFGEKGAKMLFVYDFLKLWTFYLEVLKVQEPDPEKKYPLLAAAWGETPEEAPEKEMSAEDDDLLNGNISGEEDDFDEGDYREEDWY